MTPKTIEAFQIINDWKIYTGPNFDDCKIIEVEYFDISKYVPGRWGFNVKMCVGTKDKETCQEQ